MRAREGSGACLPSPPGPRSLGLQTYHKVLLGEDFLLVEVSELMGLLLQLLPQHRTALSGDRNRWACAQDRAAFAGISSTEPFKQTCQGMSKCRLRGRKLRPPRAPGPGLGLGVPKPKF